MLRVYSKRDKIFTKVNATVVNDIDESWISKDLAERLELNVVWMTSRDMDILGRRRFNSMERPSCSGLSKASRNYTKCHIVPDKSFEVYLHCSQWHPASRREKDPLIVPDPQPNLLPPALNEVSPSTTNHSAAMAGSFDGDGLAEALDDHSKEYYFPARIFAQRLTKTGLSGRIRGCPIWRPMSTSISRSH